MDMHSEHDHSHEHADHDHAGGGSMDMAMGGMDMGGSGSAMPHDKFHSVVSRRPDGSYYYTHGAFLGHMLPGTFFTLWGVWWMVCTFHTYLQAMASRRGYKSRAWYPVFFGPGWLQRLPLEPIVKVAFPTIGILGELWLGHGTFRYLVASDGRFITDNINDWQHSTMYLAFVISGAVDLLGHYSSLPEGAERAFLGLAYLAEGTLLAFHLKGPPIEVMVHLILVLQIFGTVIALAVEAARENSVIAGAVRPAVTLLQGVWWIQTAYIMYTSDPAYDPDEMGGTMMTPVVLVAHMLWIAASSIMLLCVMRALQSRILGREIPFSPLKNTEENGYEAANGRLAAYGDEDIHLGDHSMEMASLRLAK